MKNAMKLLNILKKVQEIIKKMRIYISDLSVSMIDKINKKVSGGTEKFKPNVLYPYAHLESGNDNTELRKLIEAKNRDIYNSLMLDSGTYVMHQLEEEKGIHFDYKLGCDRYIDFVKGVSDFVDYYINYDVSFGYKDGSTKIPYHQSLNTYSQETLESNGLNPVYVMHSASPNEMQYVYDKKYKFVAISSAILNSKEFEHANDIIKKFYKKGIKTHLLGCASYNRLSQTCAWSCDASSYGRWASFGKMIYFSERENKEIQLSVSEYNKKNELNSDYYLLKENQKYVYEYEDFMFPSLGLGVDEIVSDKSSSNLILANAYYMYHLEKIINDIQRENKITFDIL